MTQDSGDNKTRDELLDEAEQALEAIRNCDVDALVVSGPHGEQVFSLTGSESSCRLIYETMNEAALMVAVDGTVLSCNRRFSELMKSPMKDCIGSKLARFAAPAHLQRVQRLISDAGTGPFKRQCDLRAADGSTVSMQIAVSTIPNDDDMNICLIATDLTELELQAGSISAMLKQQQTLEEHQAELQTVNASLRNSRLAALNLMQDAVESRKRLEELTFSLQRAQEELEQRVAERTMELAATITALQKEIREREIAEKNLRDEIAERLRIMDTLREKEQMLLQQSRLAAMGEMINNIAHQWRQPLNRVGLNVQRLPYFYGTDKFNKEFLDMTVRDIMSQINHMSQTIDDFRNFFKPDKKKVDFNINAAIQQALSLIDDSFKSSCIEVITQITDDQFVFGYPNEFSQVLLNILQNARDAILECKIKNGFVSIFSSNENGKRVIIISDNAGGIPEDIIDKVFEPYFSTKGIMGTGIGLNMSKNIIETNMGGRLTVRNIVGGAEFRIEV